MDFHGKNILIMIEGLKDSLTPVGKKLAEYVLKNAKSVPSMSIKELAIKSETSDAAVMRFCKSLGFSSYRELIIALSLSTGKSDYNSSVLSHYVDVCSGDSIHDVIRNISYSNQKSINDTMNTLDEIEVEKAVDLIEKADKLIFCGIGASGLVCMDAQQKFLRINRYCLAIADSHMQITEASLLNDKDVAVLVSASGETEEILDTLRQLKENNVPVIAITRYSKSRLAEKADILLSISTPEQVIRSGAMGSRIAMLNVIDILYAGILSRNFDSFVFSLEKTRKALEGKKK